MREGTPAQHTAGNASGLHRQCARCSPGLYRRVNRSTLLERTLMTWLGLFPWECVSCRKKRYFRNAGRRPSSASAGVITS